MLTIYRASAGSGKTFRLTQDYIHLLFKSNKKRSHRRILAVTFTNKATEEMKSRILKELYQLSVGGKSDYKEGLMEEFQLNSTQVEERASEILKSLLHDYSSFSISTIDAFFQQVIRAFAREIGVNGSYRLELDHHDVLEEAVESMFKDLSKQENKQLLHWLIQFTEDQIEESGKWQIRQSILTLGENIFKENYQTKIDVLSEAMHNRDLINIYQKKLRALKSDFETRFLALQEKALQALKKHGLTHNDFANSRTETLEKPGLSKTDAKKRFKLSAFNRLSECLQDVSKCYTKKADPEIKSRIEAAYADGFYEALRAMDEMGKVDFVHFQSAGIILKQLNTLGILSDLILKIKELSQEQNALLISDTNMLIHKIIDKSDSPFIYEKTGIYINHYMIDEFQDTSNLQWKNFHPLIANSLAAGNANLVVGDVKQSIYRFRSSDWQLLDEQIFHDFRKDEIDTENLDTNWRSDKNIVNFNNIFFKRAADSLQNELNLSLNSVLSIYPDLQPYTQKISHAYEQTHQKFSPRAGEGYVKISFIPSQGNSKDWKNESLERLPSLLEDLQKRGFQPSEIAILVAKRAEAAMVSEYLLEYKKSEAAQPGFIYDVIGEEGILINSSSSVRFIIALLKLIIQPDDELQRLQMNLEYAAGHLKLSADDMYRVVLGKKSNTGEFSSLFSQEQNQLLRSFSTNAIFSLVERIVVLFSLNEWDGQSVFIQAFQDVVYKYSTKSTPDLNSFLLWWDRTGIKQTISMPEQQNAFRIMTIHKSKGLDFEVVIMPFLEGKFKSRGGNQKKILWCEPKEAPFDELPLLPIEYSDSLQDSIFAKNYYEELMQQYIDSLNVAYVAFTRAKHELYCFAASLEKESNESISMLMHSTFRNNLLYWEDQKQEGFYSDDTLCYELGIPLIKQQGDSVNLPPHENVITSYPSFESNNRLRMKHELQKHISLQGDNDLTPLDYGILMHEVLCNINTRKEEDFILLQMKREGRINDKEMNEIKNGLHQFWNMDIPEEWFDSTSQILKESTILTPNGKQYRPDRVVLKGNKAIVIDYKFGSHELDKYIQQVKQYMSLISTMNLEVQGYICYVTLKKITPVV